MRVLIVYDTKYGATQEIADRIAIGIQKSGLDVTVAHAKAAPAPDLFDAVVIGSAVYIGGWRKHAKKYLLKHQTVLAQKHVWLFSSGPTGEGDPVELLKGWTLPDNLKAAAAVIHPAEVTVFHGAVFMDKLGVIDRWLATKVKSPVGDFRDWAAVDAFAERIANSRGR